MGNATISAFGFVPLFELTQDAAPQFVLVSQVSKIGVAVTGGDFQPAGQSPFSELDLEADFRLEKSFAPTFELKFLDKQGKELEDGVFTDLKSILAATPAGKLARDGIGEVLVQCSYWLYRYLGTSPKTIGDVLVDAGLLGFDTEEQQYHFDETALQGLIGKPLETLKKLLFSILSAMSDTEKPLIPVHGGGIWLTKDGNDYGARLAIPEIKVPLGGSSEDKSKSKPTLHLRLGEWFSGETDSDGWVNSLTKKKLHPGISVFLLHYDPPPSNPDGTSVSAGDISFAPSFELVSLGFDLTGSGGKPLFDHKGYTLGGAELRLYINQKDHMDFGFGARLDDVGVPLGAGFKGGSGGGNPVAKGLVSSGSDGGGAAEGKTDAVNPSFSLEAAWIKSSSYLIELAGPDGKSNETVWFPIQRQLGPLLCQRIGVKLDSSNKADPLLQLVFDGGVKIAVLEVDLIHSMVGLPLAHMGDLSAYQLGLDGLDIYFNSGGVEVAGGLLKNDEITSEHPILTYDGFAILKFEAYSLSAFGSYGVLANQPSMFIFAMLTGPIGGPPFAVLTGIAAGFGYNRGLKLPAEAKDVVDFPFLALLPDPMKESDSDAKPPHPDSVLKMLGPAVPPQRGEYWLAAGVQITSFDLISATVLLVIKFGQEFEIDILGIARTKLPQVGPTYVYAELGLIATFNPAHGILMIKAALTDNSFLLDKNCHLTGGFALMTWFDPSENAGNFVLTVGGYHPRVQAARFLSQGRPGRLQLALLGQDHALGGRLLRADPHRRHGRRGASTSSFIRAGCVHGRSPTPISSSSGSRFFSMRRSGSRSGFPTASTSCSCTRPSRSRCPLSSRCGGHRPAAWRTSIGSSSPSRSVSARTSRFPRPRSPGTSSRPCCRARRSRRTRRRPMPHGGSGTTRPLPRLRPRSFPSTRARG